MRPPDPILLVEDEPDAVTLLQHAFARAGVSASVQAVHDGEQAIAYLRGEGRYGDRGAHPLPQLVLLDLKLPRCSGHEVLTWLRSQPHLRTTVVVVMTSSKERRDVERAYASGANSYVVKPSSFDCLVELARAFGDYWLGHNEPPPRPVPA